MADDVEAGPLTGDAAVESIGALINSESDGPTEEIEQAEAESEEIEEVEAVEVEADEVDEGGAEDEQDEDELPEVEAIEPPLSWSEADKEVFSSLPAEAQQAIASREADREAHLTKTTQEFSQRRKEFEAQSAEIAQERQRAAEQLVPLMNMMHQQIQTQAVDLQTYLDDGDTEGYLRAKADLEQKQEMLRVAEGERQRMAQQHEADTRRKQRERLEKEQEALLAALPAWSDEDKRTAESKKIADYLEAEAFSSDEVGSLIDHRMVKVAQKAMMWDELQKSKPKISKKLEKKPKVIKPGAPASKEARDGKKSAAIKRKLKANPRSRDAQASALGQFL